MSAEFASSLREDEIRERNKRYLRRTGLGQYTESGEDIKDLLEMLDAARERIRELEGK